MASFDRYRNYDKIPGVIHQLCCQHLLRDLEDAAESYPAAIWPGQIAGTFNPLPLLPKVDDSASQFLT